MSGANPEDVGKAIFTDRFAVLARTGLSVAAIDSWDEQLSRDSRLLVPIDVQALVVDAGGGEAVPTETVLPLVAEGDTQGVLPVPPAPFGKPFQRAPGVHLHWAMPDGLTRGDAGAASATAPPAGNPMGLPPLPDRWVIVRAVHGRTDVQTWVLEADRGDRHDLAGWKEPGPPPADTVTGASGRRLIPNAALTAVAGGDPAWAATYDAVLDRFGFHDDLRDLGGPAAVAGEVASYLVAGWWSDPALDPLRDCTSAGAYGERTRALGWLAPEPTGLTGGTVSRTAERERRENLSLPSAPQSGTGQVASGPQGFIDVMSGTGRLSVDKSALIAALGPAMPRLTLAHGTVLGVPLGGRGPDLQPAPSAVAVALGASGFAALSALLADGEGDERTGMERSLAAFGAGLLATIDSPTGLAAVDEDRHAGAFTAVEGGQRSRPDRIAEGDPLAAERKAPPSRQAAAAAERGSTRQEPLAPKSRLVARTKASVESAIIEHRFPDGIKPVQSDPRTYRDVPVPLPRRFVPSDTALVIRGVARSLRHGDDGRFTADGLLACRLPSEVVKALTGLLAADRLPPGLTTVGSGAVPQEIDLLLRELALTDPYRWREAVGWAKGGGAGGLPPESVALRLRAEAALRAVRATSRSLTPELDDHVVDAVRPASLVDGKDVSPVGVTRWAQPWVPLWCDWELRLRVDDRLDRWTLGPIDYDAEAPDAPPESERTLRGRTLLVSAAAKALAAQIRAWLADEQARDDAGVSQVTDLQEDELAAAATAAEGLDVLTGSLAGMRETLLGLDPLDAARTPIEADGTPKSAPTALDLPLLLAGGAGRLTALRVVDAFGRWIDVPDDRLAAMEIATAAAHPDGAPAFTLPPRLTRPSRISFRFVDPRVDDGAPDIEARIDQQFPDLAVSPVAGWLLPDHVDEACECFDAAGTPLGQLMHDELTGAVVWEGAPGRPGPAGVPPDPGDDPGARHVTRFAAGLVAADAAARNDPEHDPGESALSALLRAIDTTLWTVDPLGSIGSGAVAGLVGRPIAVVRATLRLDVDADVDALAYAAGDAEAMRAARERAFAELAARALPVRLGELTRVDDGLFAYAVGDDYSQLSLTAPEVRTRAKVSGRLRGQLTVFGRGSVRPPQESTIRHRYVAGAPFVAARSGVRVSLTLLLSPGGKVHATCGVLPRKSLALARDWFHDALVRISPSFRVGPLLADPDAVRLPMVTGLGDRQEYTRRDTPLSWRDDPIVAATHTAYLPDLPSSLSEGWIRVEQVDPGTGGTT